MHMVEALLRVNKIAAEGDAERLDVANQSLLVQELRAKHGQYKFPVHAATPFSGLLRDFL
jgi:hypothetical protein